MSVFISKCTFLLVFFIWPFNCCSRAFDLVIRTVGMLLSSWFKRNLVYSFPQLHHQQTVWKLWNILTFLFIKLLNLCSQVPYYLPTWQVCGSLCHHFQCHAPKVQHWDSVLASSGLSPVEGFSYNIKNIVNISMKLHYISWFITQCKNTNFISGFMYVTLSCILCKNPTFFPVRFG